MSGISFRMGNCSIGRAAPGSRTGLSWGLRVSGFGNWGWRGWRTISMVSYTHWLALVCVKERIWMWCSYLVPETIECWRSMAEYYYCGC